MIILKLLRSSHLWRAILFLALGYFMTAVRVQAQCGSTGYNAIWGSNCSGKSNQGSFAMVDATQFSGGSDVCKRIQNSFSTLPANSNYGMAVDARGLQPPYTCTVNPWANWPSDLPPSLVLLPAGTIPTSTTWIMPQFARVIGEGPGVTILQATFNGDMIEMGPPSSPGNYCSHITQNNTYDCPGIQIEHLTLDGNNQAANGVINYYGEELSYVADVAFKNIPGTALSLTTPANQDGSSWNSGPYSNLTMSNVGTCVSLTGAAGFPLPDTRGIHGLTCATTNQPVSPAAIVIDGANNNSLEDISLTGSNNDGILIGNLSTSNGAQNNILFNISGSGFTNLIHISGVKSTSQTNCPGTVQGSGSVYNVCDITIMGVTNGGAGTPGTGLITIKDEVSGATLPDSTVGMYVLGEPVQYGTNGSTNNNFLGSSHFTTSLNWPTWVVGANQPNGNCPISMVGSLYSVTGGSTPTLLECESSSGSSSWQVVQ
jgi:hypothetical protein